MIRIHNLVECFLSSSPRTYVVNVVKHFNMPSKNNAIQGTKTINPHPSPMLKALVLFGCTIKKAISFANRVMVTLSSNAGGIE